MASDRSRLTPHRRKHWSVEPAAPQETPGSRCCRPRRRAWRRSGSCGVTRRSSSSASSSRSSWPRFLPRLAPGLVADRRAPHPVPARAAHSRLAAPRRSMQPSARWSTRASGSTRRSRRSPRSRSHRRAHSSRSTPTRPRDPRGSHRPRSDPRRLPRRPSQRPRSPPRVTPIPPPTVSIDCSVVLLTVTCDAATSHIDAGSQRWSMGGDGVLVFGGDGANSVVWTYLQAGTYTVTMTVDGDDGSRSATAPRSTT